MLPVFLGPNAPVGHGSVLPIVEHAAKYILQMIYKSQTEDIKSVEVKQRLLMISISTSRLL